MTHTCSPLPSGIIRVFHSFGYAAGARAQGASGVGVDGMANAGSCGKHTQNIHRSLMSVFGSPVGAPPLRYFNIPTKQSDHVSHPFLLPHEFINSLYHHRRERFDQLIRGAEDSAQSFWESMQTSDFVSKHPSLKPENFWRTLPIGFHGDAGSFTNADGFRLV